MADTDRTAALAERTATIQRLRQNMPAAMRERKQWLLWKLERVEGRDGLQKVPYWISGGKRRGDLGSPADRKALATFDEALSRFAAAMHFTGVGFAFLDGDGLIGIDLDWKETADGQPLPHHEAVLEACPSFTEDSPSGKGVHIIVSGPEIDSFKHDSVGIEVYCGGRYFTCTGHRHASKPAEVEPVSAQALAYMKDLVDKAKDEARQAKRAEHPPAPVATAAVPTTRHEAPGQQTNDFRRINDMAHQQLSAWVPHVLPKAREWQGGYRITSKELGRDLQEDLQLLPKGIMDFGEERGMSPIDVVMQWLPGMTKPKDALLWLAAQMGVQLSGAPPRRPPPAASSAPPAPSPPAASPPPEPEAVAGDEADADNVIPIGKAKRARASKPGKGAAGGEPKPGKKLPKEVWDLVDALCARFSLIYSTDQAWDHAELMLVKIAAMRYAFGKVAVNLWLSRSAPARRMIRPVDLVFEPGTDPAPPAVNMFAGLDLEPVPCTDEEVAPMLALLRHLCCESELAPRKRAEERGEAAGDDVEAVMHWVLCWMALPLQQLGTKMATACVFHGAQGTGKNLFWDVWRDLFGVYGVTVGQTELEDKFNGWVSRKLAIIGDEVVSRQEMYHNKNRLKLVVTQQDKFPIRGMLQETRWESNHANVVFLSNESQPLALEERDRRYMVIYTPLEADVALYEEAKAFKAGDGPAKWLYYLQHYPLGDFGAHTKPLMTQAKEDLIKAAWKPAVLFANDWLEGVLELPVRVCSVEQLYRAFRRWCDSTGAKWPPDQAGFTGEVNRWVRERVRRMPDGRYEAPRLIYKAVTLASDAISHRRTVRCWLPDGTGPCNGISEGEWALDSINTFEADLRAFCRPRGGAALGESE